jgi:hypothetical protein
MNKLIFVGLCVAVLAYSGVIVLGLHNLCKYIIKQGHYRGNGWKNVLFYICSLALFSICLCELIYKLVE